MEESLGRLGVGLARKNNIKFTTSLVLNQIQPLLTNLCVLAWFLA